MHTLCTSIELFQLELEPCIRVSDRFEDICVSSIPVIRVPAAAPNEDFSTQLLRRLDSNGFLNSFTSWSDWRRGLQATGCDPGISVTTSTLLANRCGKRRK